MTPVIQHLLETDLYKFTMWQTLLHGHPQAQTEYRFVCRNETAYPLAELLPELNAQLDHLCGLSFTEDELAYLSSLRFIKADFVDFLRIFRFQRRFIRAEANGNDLEIVAEGPQVHVMGFEIYVLAIVNELYFRRFDAAPALAEGRKRLQAKVAQLKAFGDEPARAFPFEFFDFGVRRRYSGAWHEEVVRTLRDAVPQYFKGTSNVHLARTLGLVPIGTMAHEYLQAYQSFGVRLRDFQKAALEDWVQEYRGDLGVALTDVVGMDAFLADFDLYFAKLFDNRELKVWTHNHEFDKLWTWSSPGDDVHTGEMSGSWAFPRLPSQQGGASAGGQLACPPARVRAGEPVRQAAETAARGGRPQAEARVPVPRGARAARTGCLSTGGRACRGFSRGHRMPARQAMSVAALS